MKRWMMPCLIGPCLLAIAPAGRAQLTKLDRFVGLELRAEDVTASKRFYVEGLGFRVGAAVADGAGAVLRHGDLRIVLVPGKSSRGRAIPRGWRGPYLNMRVGCLQDAVARAVAAGGRRAAAKPHANALGQTYRLLDPAGHPLNLMQLDRVHGEHVGGPDVFNIGLRSSSLERVERFYAAIGFRVPTRAYLPRTLPLARTGCESLVIHHDADAASLPTLGRLVIEVDDLDGPRWRAAGAVRLTSAGRARTIELLDGVEGLLVDRPPRAVPRSGKRGGNLVPRDVIRSGLKLRCGCPSSEPAAGTAPIGR